MGVRYISDRRHWQAGAGACALALLAVLLIAFVQGAGWLDAFNHSLMNAAGAARDTGWGAHATPLLRLATTLGDTIFRLGILTLALGWLAWRGRRRDAVWLAALMAGGTLLNLALKQLFSAPRPDLLPHLDIVASYSFPSGHAAGNMMLFGALALLAARRSVWLAAGLMIGLIGISRVWLGVHWPTDVLAGWIEGLGWLLLWRAFLPAGRGEQQGA